MYKCMLVNMNGGSGGLNPVVKSYSVSFVYPGGVPAIVPYIELKPGGSGV